MDEKKAKNHKTLMENQNKIKFHFPQKKRKASHFSLPNNP
jgi:hypothetical protein